MEFREFEILQDIDRKYKHVFVYGAGEYATNLLNYIKDSLHIEGVVISDTEGNNHLDEINGYKVAQISEVISAREETCFVLALSEKYHKDVKNAIHAKGYNYIVSFNNELFEKLKIYDVIEKYVCDINLEYNVEAFQKNIGEEYDEIEISEVLISRFGPMMVFLMEKQEENRAEFDKVLQLLIPISFDQQGKKVYLAEKNCANGFLFRYLKARFQLLTQDNILYWWHILNIHKQMVHYTGRYNYEKLMQRQKQKGENATRILSDFKFEFSHQEVKVGEQNLKKFHINREYVCFFTRSNRYFKEAVGNSSEAQSEFRSISVSKFKLMGERLFELGYQSVRMGYLVDDKIDGKGIVDYSNLYRDEFMDFYLVYHSRFVICQFSGVHLIPIMFNKPVLITDNITLTIQGDYVDSCNPYKDLILSKKLWSSKEKRYLTFRERLSFEEKYKDLFLLTNFYKDNGYKFVENTAEEIWDAVEEMLERLDGHFCYDEEDIELQEKYRNLIHESVKRSGNYYWDVPVSRKFLKANRWMLE